MFIYPNMAVWIWNLCCYGGFPSISKAYLPDVSGIGLVKLDMVPPLTVLWRKQDMQLVARTSYRYTGPED